MIQSWEQKCWGRVWHIFCSEQTSLSWLEVKAGTCCSKHMHRERNNQFLVLSGTICIEEFCNVEVVPSLRDLVFRRRILRATDAYMVPAGIKHRFRVLEDGELIEIYWPIAGGEVRQDDIIRDDVGTGQDDQTELLKELYDAGLYDRRRS